MERRTLDIQARPQDLHAKLVGAAYTEAWENPEEDYLFDVRVDLEGMPYTELWRVEVGPDEAPPGTADPGTIWPQVSEVLFVARLLDPQETP